MLDIVYCCNDKYFEGLYLSILSILNRSKETFCFTVLTAELPHINKSYTNLSSYHISLLYELIKSFNKDNMLKIFDCSQRYNEVFGTQDIQRYSPYTMLKLFIPECYESGNVLYIDTDIMANGDVSSAFDVDTNGVEMYVCHDYYRQIVLNNPESKYFSGGVWLINIEEVKKTNLFYKAMEYFNKYHPFGNEEESLNNCVTSIKYFPHEYRYNWQGPGIDDKVILKHFVYTGEQVNIKQWDIIGVRKVLEMNNWDIDYQYFLNQKRGWIKPPQIYNIMYSCNDAIFDGLYLSIQSILLRTKETINFFVLTGDLSYINPKYKPVSPKHIEILEKMIKSFNPNNTLTILDCTDKYIKTLGKEYDNVYFTPYALFRLLIDQFGEIEGLMLYLDVDVLANDDIKSIWNIDMNCAEICICEDYWLANNKKSENNLPFFNSGVMLINLDFIRTTKYFSKAIKYLIDKKPKMADQEALFHTWYRIKAWNNQYRYNYQQLGIKEDTILKHFNGTESNAVGDQLIKPWNIDGVQNVLKLHNWDKDFELFKQDKIKW